MFDFLIECWQRLFKAKAAYPQAAPRILMYHMVSEHKKAARFNKLRVTPAMFERQLAYLHAEGYYFAFLSQLATAQDLPQKCVVLTFDDGFMDNYSEALPIMRRYGARATLFLVVDRHQRDWSVNKKKHHDSGELKNEPKLSDAQVREMLASGLFELGGHTVTHVHQPSCDDEQAMQEILQGKLQIESEFACQCCSFAYPFGHYRAQHVRMVGEAGFTLAVTTREGCEPVQQGNRLELPRIKVGGKKSLGYFKRSLLRRQG